LIFDEVMTGFRVDAGGAQEILDKKILKLLEKIML
jgi:glutamate-1-semialdehyde aminotransferase